MYFFINTNKINVFKEYLQWINTKLNFDAKNSGINIVEDLPTIIGLPRNIRFLWEISQSNNSIAKIRQVLLPNVNSIQITSTENSANIQIIKDLWTRLLTPILNLWKRINQNNPLLTGKTDLFSHSNAHTQVLKRISIVDVESFIEVLKLEHTFGVVLVIIFISVINLKFFFRCAKYIII